MAVRRTIRGYLSRTAWMLALPAVLAVVGGAGMAWASSSVPDEQPPAEEAPTVSTDDDGSTPYVSTRTWPRGAAAYWTPERMRDAKPAEMPVPTAP